MNLVLLEILLYIVCIKLNIDLLKNPSIFNGYHKFMEDYLKLGHMELIPENEIDVPVNSSFYLPHHPVPNKSGDKFRVVFDGSAKSSTGVSLNDKLMVGPQLQTDLTTILIRFRMHKNSHDS
ncbi:uncharacterized protein LOC103569155 [Caerostris extrusa]|uniref:Uncharacterized protein LOC103569155, partial n=1 Tax=Caerostris extrusa TaxID=172846 RepID=A0AAV4S369_CAEEX|nr:uncharacterized protein LOC103569155 [Caerostris extrusa]